MSEQRRLLVANHAANGNFASDKRFVRSTVVITRTVHFGEHTFGYTEQLQQILVPLESMYVKQHCTAGVSVVGSENFAAGKLPHKVSVNRAEQQIALFRTFARTRYVVKNPFNLSSGEIRVQHKPRLVVNHIGKPLRLQLFTVLGGSAALPHYGVIYGFAGIFVPNKGSFALIGNTYRRNIRGGHVGAN